MTPLARVLARVTVTPFGCWDFGGYRDDLGYGRASWDGRRWLTHRMVWTLLVGPIPDGLVMDHLCRNTSCCNPEHLEPVTHSVNVLRGLAPARLIERLSAITHCPYGHPFSPQNTYVQRGGVSGRQCLICKRAASRRYYARNAARLAESARNRRALRGIAS